jgi:tetratricopeptide (TPR) repeat protein
VDYTFCMLRAFAAALMFLLVLPPAVSAQGRVTGVVKDAEGHPIKGASITAENSNWSATTVTTDVKGRYSFLGLRGGTWTLTVKAPGFQTARKQSTTRTQGVNAQVDFQLEALGETAPLGPLANLDTQELQQQLTAAAELDKAGHLDAAIARYREILTRVPALTSVHLPLGALLERKGDTTAAVAEYEAALKADPASVKARAALDRLGRR